MPTITPQVSILWNYISSAYSEFADKTLIEEFWQSMGNGIQLLYDNLGNVQNSRIMSLLEPTFDHGPQRFIIVYSGVLPAYAAASGTNIIVPEVAQTNTTFVLENITNTNFEINTSGWSLGPGTVQSPAHSHTGTKSLLIPPLSYASYSFPIQVFSPNRFQIWVWLDNSQAYAGIQLIGPNGLVTALQVDITKIGQWQLVQSDHLTSAITQILIFNPNTGTVPANVYIDDVSLANPYKFSFPIDPYTYSIPSISYSYSYNGVTYSGLYIQGQDYVINTSMDAVLWITSPNRDLRYAALGVINGVAPSVLKINKALTNIWCKAIKLDAKNYFPQYSTFGNDKYLHLKMFAWALTKHKRSAPSIYTLKNAYGITHGLPFAYASGILNYSYINNLYNVTVGSYTYILPSGVVPRPAGAAYDTFEVIASGLNLWDHTTNAGLINLYSNGFNNNNILAYQLDPTLSGLSFSQDFLNFYMSSIMPKQVKAFECFKPGYFSTGINTILPAYLVPVQVSETM